MLITAPCRRLVRDVDLFLQNLKQEVTRVIQGTQSFHVVLQTMVTGQEWDDVSHARWFRFVNIETLPADEALNVFLTGLIDYPRLSPNHQFGLIWLPEQTLPLSALEMDGLSTSQRNLDALIARGRHIFLGGIHTAYAMMQRNEDCKKRRHSLDVLEQLYNAWTLSLEIESGNNARRVLQLRTRELFIARWK